MISGYRLPYKNTSLPLNYHFIDCYYGVQYHYRRTDGLSIISGEENHDGEWWLHVSCAKKNKLPTWYDLKEVKKYFIGEDKKAIQILPAKTEFINIHKFCLHLFYKDNDNLPDFGWLGVI